MTILANSSNQREPSLGMTVGEALPAPTTNNQAGTNATMEHQLAELGTLLSELQLTVAKFTKLGADDQLKIDQNFLQASREATDKIASELKKVAEERAARAHESLFDRIMGDILTALTLIVAAGTGNWALFAITLTFTIMSQTGAMSNLEQKLSELFQKIPGCSTAVANLLADITVVVAAVLITHSGGSAMGQLAGGAAKTATVAEDSEEVEMTTINSSSVNADTTAEEETTAENTATENRGMLSRIKGIGKGLSKQAAANILVGTQALINSNFSQDIVALIASACGRNEAKALGLEIFTEMLIALGAAIAGGAALNGLSSGMSVGAEAAGDFRSASSFTGRLREGLSGFFDSTSPTFTRAKAAGLQLLYMTQDMALIASAGDGVTSGITSSQQAETTARLGQAQASVAFFRELMEMIDLGFSTFGNTSFAQIKQLNQEGGALGAAFAGPNNTVTRELAV